MRIPPYGSDEEKRRQTIEEFDSLWELFTWIDNIKLGTTHDFLSGAEYFKREVLYIIADNDFFTKAVEKIRII